MRAVVSPSGHTFELDGATAFFGNRKTGETVIADLYPTINLSFLKQVHGSDVVEASNSSKVRIPADAHWTREKQLAVAVYTADCIPCLIFCPIQKIVMAVHAGWRGVKARIIPTAIVALKNQGVTPEQLLVFLGPHIQKENFEVGLDVGLDLAGSCKNGARFLSAHPVPEKCFVDLHQVAINQLQESGVLPSQCFSVPIDTYQDPEYSSYRREKGTGDRQISFIYLKK